ncbi:MAG: CesT family type III secretion system chaperone [Puniceicoccales bacterium]|jgi:hypothetical protein|nr:CesT family type III secretion system chaperone [Puniceicoccales bacterium]
MTLHDFVTLIYKQLGMPAPKMNEEAKYEFIVDEHWEVSVYAKQKQFMLQAKIGKPLSPSNEEQNCTLLREILDFNLRTMRVMDEIFCMDGETQQLYCRKLLNPSDLNERNGWSFVEDFLVNLEIIEDRFFSNVPKDKGPMHPSFLS